MNDATIPMSHEKAEITKAVEGYLLDDLSDDQRSRFEAHFFECQICADAIFSGQSLLEAIRHPEPWWKRLAFWFLIRLN